VFRNNLLFNGGLHMFGYGVGPGDLCGDWQGLDSIDAITTHMKSVCTDSTLGACMFFGGTQVDGNITLRASCGNDSGCVQWSSCDAPLSCLESIFSDWSELDTGYETFLGAGWKLQRGLPCTVTQSSLDAGVAVDHYGNARTAPPSLGAHEFDGPCL
jgi:hypothetical protein